MTSSPNVTALRLSAQGLGRPLHDAVDVASHLLAVQAQDYVAGLQATASRTCGTASDVAAALDAGELVRTWPMRGTLHLIRPGDLAFLLPLTRDRVHRSAAGRHRQLGLAAEDFARAGDAVRDRLHDVRATRAELLAAIRDAGVSVEGQRGIHLLGALARDGVVVQTTKDTYVRFEALVPEVGIGRDEALARLALRYVTGHGPVTDRDLAWWAGLTLTEVRGALGAVRDQLDVIEVDGVTYFVRPGLEPAPGGVWLLPMFDEYLIGYADRRAQLGGEPLERVVPGLNGMFLPIVVVDGIVVGTWSKKVVKGLVQIVPNLFADVPRRRWPELEAAVARWAHLAGVEAVLADAR